MQNPSRVNLPEIVWSWVGSLLGIAIVGLLDECFCRCTELVLIIGSFGASAVLVLGAVKSPPAQPKDLLGGHILSALIGVTAYRLLPTHIRLASALAMALLVNNIPRTRKYPEFWF